MSLQGLLRHLAVARLRTNQRDEDGNAYFKCFHFNKWLLSFEWHDVSDSADDSYDINIHMTVCYNSDNNRRTIGSFYLGDEDFQKLIRTHYPCAECDTMLADSMISDDFAKSHDNTHLCHDCFAKAMKHTEDCCCCMENNWAVWIKLPCNHVLHKKCFYKI